MIYIGIDPGAKGAMTILGESAVKIYPFDPTKYISVLREIHERELDCVCCIEAVHSISGQGIASSFRFGQTYGYLLGLLEAFGISYQPITPQKWKKEFGLNSDKTGSVEVCKRLFPGVSLLRTERSRKDDDNMAESALLALYAKRKF